jgi:hypothetical protein
MEALQVLEMPQRLAKWLRRSCCGNTGEERRYISGLEEIQIRQMGRSESEMIGEMSGRLCRS